MNRFDKRPSAIDEGCRTAQGVSLWRANEQALFIRPHRSMIVRRDRIVRLAHDGQGNWAAELADRRQLRIGRTYLSSVKDSVTRE